MTKRDNLAGYLCTSPETAGVSETRDGARARSVFDSALLDHLVFATAVVALGFFVYGLGL